MDSAESSAVTDLPQILSPLPEAPQEQGEEEEMNYFTPALLLRFGSDDEGIAHAAQEEWDDACDRCNTFLDSIKAQLPPGLRQVEESYALHDARMQGMWRRGRSFVILLRLHTPPHSLLTFTFQLLSEPVINREPLPPELRSKGNIVD